MANRSYPNFGKVKTIVLPYVQEFDGIPATLDEFKEKTGIDLKPFVYLGAGGIVSLRAPNTMFLLNSDGAYGKAYSLISAPNQIDSHTWEKDANDGDFILHIFDSNSNFDFTFSLIVDKDSDFLIDNVKITTTAM